MTTQPETQPNPTAAKHLFDKLAETALKLQSERTLTSHEIAVAFIAVGVEVARVQHGSVGVAEWLRDIADEVEMQDKRLRGNRQ